MGEMADYIEIFREVFFGDQKKYTAHNPPFVNKENGKKVCTGKPFYVRDKKKKEYLPITDQVFRDHLSGKRGVAVEPLIPGNQTESMDDQCLFSVIDIDYYVEDPVTYVTLVKALKKSGLLFFAVVTKSNGLHLFFTYNAIEKAESVLETMNRIVTFFGLAAAYRKGSTSCVEIFPLHTSNGDSQNGKCVLLPYFNAKNGDPLTKVLAESGVLLSIKNACSEMRNARTSLAHLNNVMDHAGYSDAPYCISAILSGKHLVAQRNVFLFHCAVYLAKKSGADVQIDDLLKMDLMLNNPLQYDSGGIGEIEAIVGSVNKKTYGFTCSKDPMKTFCNKKECAKRLISGVKSSKPGKNITTGVDFFGEINRFRGADWAYYEWEIKPGDKEPKKIRFDSESDMLDQRKFQARCIEHANFCPNRVREDVWTSIVNKALTGIEGRETVINAAVDTSISARFRYYLISYLICYIDRSDLKALFLGQACVKEDGCYFTTEGVLAYMASVGFSLKGVNVHNQFLKSGCEQIVVSIQKKSGIGNLEVSCWFRKRDMEMVNALETQKLLPKTITLYKDREEKENGDIRGIEF